MGMTLEIPDDLAGVIQEEAKQLGKDPSQYAIERMKNFFAVAKNIPSNTESKSFRPFVQFMTELGDKCGYPEDWKTSTPPMTEEDAVAIENAFRETYNGNKK